ncbi:alginate lyase family protein [Sphingomonas sp. BIUV-7]|uniref:Alginate lyase family protein n=1 Tax=Sphingomonas natans TaxID=3063330 RepID=A0ABT8Y789_9SPHN|nr:alginate lyase family protein [Sphingomonas sp. BIUV-7]MDO6414188.1 alginate lyase family protein [Sphingomonas sp. BIUV-7]
MDRRTLLTALALAPFTAGAVSAASEPDREAIRQRERPRVVAAANRFLSLRPTTVTARRATRSPGRAHDYYSEGDYWWPDPERPGGPYIRRDGYSNPDRFDEHRQALISFSVQMPTLAAAWQLTADPRYARHAAEHLDAWFVNPATCMAPNLDHAQAIIGVNTGRGIGVIDTLHLVEVAQAALVLQRAGSAYPAAQGAAVRQWFARYLEWLTTSPNGLDESDEKNNHGSCYALQVAAFARLVRDRKLVMAQARSFREVLIPNQVEADGRQPLELARTKPYSYSLFNLDVLSTLATIASSADDDLWHFATADGRGLAKALAYMAPAIADKRRWPAKPDVEFFDKLPVRQVSLLFGGLALGRSDYLKLWQGLDADPETPEIIRNFPIRQPVLWI